MLHHQTPPPDEQEEQDEIGIDELDRCKGNEHQQGKEPLANRYPALLPQARADAGEQDTEAEVPHIIRAGIDDPKDGGQERDPDHRPPHRRIHTHGDPRQHGIQEDVHLPCRNDVELERRVQQPHRGDAKGGYRVAVVRHDALQRISAGSVHCLIPIAPIRPELPEIIRAVKAAHPQDTGRNLCGQLQRLRQKPRALHPFHPPIRDGIGAAEMQLLVRNAGRHHDQHADQGQEQGAADPE